MTWGKKDSNSSSFKKAKRRPGSGLKKRPKGKRATTKVEPVTVEQRRVRVRDVLVLPSHEDLDYDVVREIAESFPISGGGPFNPIAVRRVRQQEDGKEVSKTVLVAGAHRLEAAKSGGLEYIDCRYIEGDETDAKLIEIGENLWRKSVTALRHAELLTEWVQIASAKVSFSGQDVLKGKLGRPSGGVAGAARGLPAIGRSVEARRKTIERARKIARITPEAKKIAIDAELDNNQSVLLQIAKAWGATAQVKKATELAARLQGVNKLKKEDADSKASVSARVSQQGNLNNTIASEPVEPGPDETKDDKNTAKTKPVNDTTLEALEVMWKREGRELWKYTPFGARELFIETLRRARCYAKADVGSFIRDIFWGRKDIDCEALYSFAKTRGLTKIVVRKALKELLYRRKKRRGSGSRGSMYYRNKDSDWEGQAPKISGAELEAARAKHEEDRTPTLGVVDRDRKLDDYFSDIMEDPADTDDEKD